MQPRPEHPRPQFERELWLNLNGSWNFAFDFGYSGEEQGWHEELAAINQTILVPFCPECPRSGIGYTDFMPAVWYHRSFEIPAAWAGSRVLLHFGAVDYHCRAWVNGQLVGQHLGGSASFSFEITSVLQTGSNQLVVCAYDDVRSGQQPAGKQSQIYHSKGARYSRITGIWQTVWLEAVPQHYLEAVEIVPDLDNSQFVLKPLIQQERRGLTFHASLTAGEDVVTSADMAANSGAALTLALDDPHPWSPADPYLYDLRLELRDDDQVIDSVKSYAGLRKFHIEGHKFFLNNEPIFLRFVLDQGFYSDSLWTAPTDEELKADIERSMAVGFNGARLHQKVFEERFHYWADKLGYLTWGEFCDWGIDFGQPAAIYNHQREWREVVLRDRNHPSIIAWTPFNETHRGARDHFAAHFEAMHNIYDLTRALDPSRPVHEVSGYVHVITDIFTVHDYDQDPDTFRERYQSLDPQKPEDGFVRFPELSVPWEGQPYVVDEYGGTWWVEASSNEGTDRGSSWGYGNRPDTIEEVYQRIEKLTQVLTDHPHIAGYTYTQLTDIEQEENGIYTYDRQLKFDAERLKAAFGAPAAIEND